VVMPLATFPTHPRHCRLTQAVAHPCFGIFHRGLMDVVSTALIRYETSRIFMEFGVCRWMVDSVQIVLFGVWRRH
jgi:hypothetical protein